MKKRDLEKLRNAFDIPDPERKEEFLASYGDKFISRKKSDKKPVLLRFAPAMALAVLFVCLLGVMKPQHDLRKNVGTDNIIIETTGTSTATLVTTTEDPPVRTTTTSRSSGTVSVSSSTTTLSTKPDVTVPSAVTTITENNETTEFTENTSPATSTARSTASTTTKSTAKTTTKSTSKSTAKTTTESATKSTAKTSASVTTTASTSSKTTSSTSTSSVVNIPTTTTKQTSVSDNDGSGGSPPPTGCSVDYSIVPEIIYTPTDNIYETNTDKPCGGVPDDDAAVPDLVISGTIVDMIYTRIGNQPYTQFNVEIDRFIMGDSRFKKGCTISFYVKGGYMPAREFFELFPNELPYDLEITDDLTVFDAGELNDKYYPGKYSTFDLDKSGSDFPENTFIIHKD